ncbi:MAG: (d)CMP kinase [Candidatus Omnitrophota bacterium]
MNIFNAVNVVAIDGPAGSGKSTVSRFVAERLGFMYIDTGAMYRALTLKIMRENIDFSDEERIIEISEKLNLQLLPAEIGKNSIRVILEGEDVSEEIRKMEVTGNVKYIAKITLVRNNMVRFQQQMIKGINGAVMEGRDIGTVVFPDAKYKFYLDASFVERVERRLAELKAKGHTITRKEVEDDLKQRDHADKTRKVGPLKKADNAVFLDTTNLSIEDVTTKIVEMVKTR